MIFANVVSPRMKLATTRSLPVSHAADLTESFASCPARANGQCTEGALHGIIGAASVTNGPSVATFVAEWLSDRFDNKPMQTKHMKVDAAGKVHEATFEEAKEALSIDLT